MSALVEFLRARIAQDEGWVEHPLFPSVVRARLLAECEAKRRIVRECCGHETCGGGYDECSEASLLTLRHLAAVYADHPDYRDEWKP